MKKKMLPAVALLLAALLLMPLASAFADSAPAASAEPVDPLVGAWRMPPSPFGEDYSCYIVFNADGSFQNVTVFYESDAASAPTMQQVVTNETFTWRRTGERSLELRYSYLDDNGEFVTELDYDPDTDALYLWDSVYALRDRSFTPLS